MEEQNLKTEKRAKSIAAMGLVSREGAKFKVNTPSLRGKQTFYYVWRNEQGSVVCDCLEFGEEIMKDAKFRCEHILSVKYALVAKNTEKPAQPVKEEKDAETSDMPAKRMDSDEIPVGFSIEQNGFKDVWIQYHNGTAIFKNVVIISENCPRHEFFAEKFVAMMNQEMNYQKTQIAESDQGRYTPDGFPANPIPRSLTELITAKQLGMIRAICREIGIDPDEKCVELMDYKTDEISKKAASALIQHLQDLQKEDAYGRKL